MATVRTKPATDNTPNRWAGIGTTFVLAIQELEGSEPVSIFLKGGAMVEKGATWESEVRGSTYTPLGAREGYSTVTGMTWGATEMNVHLEAAFIRQGDIQVVNAEAPVSTAEVHRLLETLQSRGRECLVSLGDLVRRGILRSVKATPGRQNTVSIANGQPLPSADINRSLVLKWDWTGPGVSTFGSEQTFSGADLAGGLGGVSTKIGKGIGDLPNLAPDLATALGGAMGKLRKGIGDLRKSLQKLGDLARLPAKTANQLLGTARSVRSLVNDARALISDTTDDYKALGESAKGTASALGLGGIAGPTAAQKAAAKRAATSSKEALDAAEASIAAIFDALERRKPKTVGVRPGQSLAEIARKHLGSADRWKEIAEANDIDGQAVPATTFQLELPPRGT